MIRHPKPHRRTVKDYIRFTEDIRHIPADENIRIVSAIDKAEASIKEHEYGYAIRMVIDCYIRHDVYTMPRIAHDCNVSERQLSRIMADFYDGIARDAGLIE